MSRGLSSVIERINERLRVLDGGSAIARDVHKKMLAVVGADVEVDGEFDFERQTFGTTPTDLRRLADRLEPCRFLRCPCQIAGRIVELAASTGEQMFRKSVGRMA